MGRAQRKVGSTAAAEQALVQAKRLDRDSVTIGFLLGMVLSDEGKRSEAQEAFEELRANRPESPAGPAGLCCLAALAGEWEAARLHLDRALAQAGEMNDDILTNLAGVAVGIPDRRPQATELARRAVESLPREPWLHALYGLNLELQGRGDDAAGEFVTAKKLSKDPQELEEDIQALRSALVKN